MRGTRGGGQRTVTDLQRTHTVDDGDGNDVEARSDVRGHLREEVRCRGVCLIVETEHDASMVVVTDVAGEGDDRPGRRVVHLLG